MDGAWIRPNAPRPRRVEGGESSSLVLSASSNEILELLQSLHIKQNNHIGLIQGLESKFDNLRVKIDNEFLQIHQRLNTIIS